MIQTSIVGVLDQSCGEHIGSGLRCVLNGRRSVVSALHVIKKASEYPHGFALSVGYGKPPFLVEGLVHAEMAGDLVVYPLPAGFPTDLEAVAFWPEERLDRSTDHLATDYLFAHGFPGERSRFSIFGPGVVSKSLPYGAMQRLENLPTDLQPLQFALDFAPANMRKPEGGAPDFVDPHGLSGSPVWRIGASGRSAREWNPDRSLVVGIVTQWRPDEQILVASLASRIFEIEGAEKVLR